MARARELWRGPRHQLRRGRLTTSSPSASASRASCGVDCVVEHVEDVFVKSVLATAAGGRRIIVRHTQAGFTPTNRIRGRSSSASRDIWPNRWGRRGSPRRPRARRVGKATAGGRPGAPAQGSGGGRTWGDRGAGGVREVRAGGGTERNCGGGERLRLVSAVIPEETAISSPADEPSPLGTLARLACLASRPPLFPHGPGTPPHALNAPPQPPRPAAHAQPTWLRIPQGSGGRIQPDAAPRSCVDEEGRPRGARFVALAGRLPM